MEVSLSWYQGMAYRSEDCEIARNGEMGIERGSQLDVMVTTVNMCSSGKMVSRSEFGSWGWQL